MSSVLDTRVIRIIRWLLDQDAPKSTAVLGADLGLSQRVVRYRLSAVENYLQSHNARLLRRRGSGLSVEAGPEARANILKELAASSAAPRVYARDEREHVVLAHLLWMAPEATSVDELERVLEVSKASARRDLQRVESWLEQRGVPLVRRPGIGISAVGPEITIRQAMVQLILESVPDEVLRELCAGGAGEAVQARVRIPAGIREYLATLPLQASWRVVEDTEIAWTLAQGNSELVFSLYLAVSAVRLQADKRISMETGQQRSLTDHPVSGTARAVSDTFAQALDLELSEQEVAGVTEYLLGLATLTEQVDAGAAVEVLLDVMLTTAASLLHPSLAVDTELRRGLSMHLDRLAVRLRYGLPVHNPLLREVADRYPEVFVVAKQLGELIADDLGKPISEDEVGYITMYLSGAMERSRLRPRLRVLVVCPSGMATAWVLVSRLKAEFPEFEISQVVAAREYTNMVVDEFELVVSTVPLEPAGVPIVVVNPLLPTDDVRQIRKLAEGRSSW